MRLPDCVAVLTGASGGIGLELADQLCSAGARVLAVSRQQGKLAELMVRYRATALAAGRPAQRRRPPRRAGSGAGDGLLQPVDQRCRGQPLRHARTDGRGGPDELFDLNIKAAVQLTRLCLPLLREQPSALVVNVGSIYGSIGYPGYATYCASKFALRGFSEALRRELADTSVNVLYAAPRTTHTTMNSSAAQALNQALKVGVDDPQDVARAVLDAVQAERSELYWAGRKNFSCALTACCRAWSTAPCANNCR